MKLFLHIIVFVFVLLSSSFILTSKPPVIALLANPEPHNATDITRSVINYQYVRWLEQARADVVIIQPWYTEKQVEEILSKVNGVVWLGGDRDLNLDGQFEKTAKMILNKIMDLYDTKGISIPLWGTCQGFELIFALLADSLDVLTNFPHFNFQSSLMLNQHVRKSSKMFSGFSKEDVTNLMTKNTTAQFHNLGVSEEVFKKYPILNETLRVTSYGKDLEGKVYIATVEGFKYPLYGVQFHPEMVAYTKIEEQGIPQSMEAIKISQLFGNFFVAEAMKNNNTMTLEEMKNYDYVNGFERTPILLDEYYYFYFDKADNEIKSQGSHIISDLSTYLDRLSKIFKLYNRNRNHN